MYIFVNDQFVKAEDAKLHVSDLAIQRGYGIFDFFRVQQNTLLYVEDHLERFFQSAEQMHLSIEYSKADVHQQLRELATKNNFSDAGIKLILTGGYSSDGYTLEKPNLIMIEQPLTMAPARSLKIITHEYVREFPTIKTINYSMGIWLQQKIKAARADDVLYYFNDEISEFPRANVFVVTSNNEVLTPKKNVLCGVTRKKILQIAAPFYDAREANITMDDLKHAQEVFLTGSTKRIHPVIQIDGKNVADGNIGKITAHLQHLLSGEESRYIAERT